MNKQNKTEINSEIQRTNWWLPERKQVGAWAERGRKLTCAKFQLYSKPWGCKIGHKKQNKYYCNNYIGWQMVTRHCGDHFVRYIDAESLRSASETNILLHVKYT